MKRVVWRQLGPRGGCGGHILCPPEIAPPFLHSGANMPHRAGACCWCCDGGGLQLGYAPYTAASLRPSQHHLAAQDYTRNTAGGRPMGLPVLLSKGRWRADRRIAKLVIRPVVLLFSKTCTSHNPTLVGLPFINHTVVF